MPPPTITVLAWRVIPPPAVSFARPHRSGSQTSQALLQGTGDKLQVIVGYDQGRGEGNDVVEPGHRVAVLADDETPFFAAGYDRSDLIRGGGGPALFVLDELQTEEEAFVADLADVRVVFEVSQLRTQPLAHRGRLGGKVLLFHDLEVPQRERAGRRVAAEGVDVAKVVVLRGSLEGLEDLAPNRRGRERQVAAGYALGHRDDVRLYTVVLVTEASARAPEAADYLVDYQQGPRATADLRDLLDVAVGRDDNPAAGDNWLHDDPGHGLRQLPLHGTSYGPRAL